MTIIKIPEERGINSFSMIIPVLKAYGFNENEIKALPFGSGLINNTWKVIASGKAYILQRINQSVFKNPQFIADNTRLMADYLQARHPAYFFISPLKTLNGEEMLWWNEGYYRLLPFVEDSHTTDVADKPEQAYEAAGQFGKFTRLLSGIAVENFKITIPRFHDLSLRWGQFNDALKNGNKQRISAAQELIKTVSAKAGIVSTYEKIKADPAFRLRVTHHDTKISNVLFNEAGKGLCVIDLDTAMPGYFISDVGDMMRTYLSPVSEEEKDLSKVDVRPDFYRAIVAGYADQMKDELSMTEMQSFFYAGQFMIYMQALRFLTDYVNNDIYYGEKYEGHNLARAKNQMKLLERLASRKEDLVH